MKSILKYLHAFLFSLVLVNHALAATPTPEQIQMLQQLPPDQRQAVLKAISEGKAGKQDLPLTTPQLVKPRAVDDGRQYRKIETQGDKKVADKDAMKRELQPFGYDLFAGTPTTFAPATDIPVPDDYIVGPGDTIQVQLFGKENNEYTLVVSREGMLQFPGIGPIPVAGQKFSELQKGLLQRISEQMIGVKASITMGPLRSIRIFVLGDAFRPGSYTVSALSTMTNALFVSGGIKTIGTLRDIQLKRRGKIIARLDLYDLLLRGDTRNDARLQPGDVIFVPPIGKTVGVDGEVRRPAIYELTTEKTVDAIVSMAGGLLPTAYPAKTQLERIDRAGERTLVEVNLLADSGRKAEVQSGDVVRVFSVFEKMENIVRLTGHVERPVAQQWKQGMRITDLIPSTRFLLPKPDLGYVLVKRELQPTQQIRIVSVNLELALKNPGSENDLVLHPRDEVIVFAMSEKPVKKDEEDEKDKKPESGKADLKKSKADKVAGRKELIKKILEELQAQATANAPAQIVSVGGRVHAPGYYPMEEGMRISDLIRAGGRLQDAAYVLGAELTRYKIVDGKYRDSEHIDVDLSAILAGDKKADIVLQPYDHLTIKDIPRWSEQEYIEVLGEVKFPGRYPISKGEHLSDVLKRAGGLTEFAFPEGAVFLRESLRKREQEQLDLMAVRLEADLAAISVEQVQGDKDKQQAYALGKSLVKQLRSTKAVGRLVIDLNKIIEASEQKFAGGKLLSNGNDVALRTGDKLFIPKKTQSVTVIGEVQYQTSHLFKSSLGRDDYINKSGGFTYKADKKRVYVVRANGSVIASTENFWTFNGEGGQEIRPGDTIIVPLDAERMRPLTLWTNVTQIIYQVGVAVAAFNSAGIF